MLLIFNVTPTWAKGLAEFDGSFSSLWNMLELKTFRGLKVFRTGYPVFVGNERVRLNLMNAIIEFLTTESLAGSAERHRYAIQPYSGVGAVVG